MDESSGLIWVRRSLGIGLALTVLAYMGYVTSQFGVSNPNRPRTRRDIAKSMIKYQGSSQTAQNVYEKAVAHGNKFSDGFMSIRLDDMKESADYQLGYYREISSGRQKLPEGYVCDLAAFLRDAPQDDRLNFLGVRWDRAEEKYVYYKPGETYSAVAATKMSVDETVKGYIEHLNRLEWAFQAQIYDPKREVAYFIALQENWYLSLKIWKSNAFPDYQATSQWSVSKTRIFDEYATDEMEDEEDYEE
jgi:hypothetical protein